MISRLLGLVREQVMASYFGASGVSDAFLVAFRIPNLLRDLFAEGAFSSAFVPSFIQAKAESEQKARLLMWQLIIILGGATFIFGILIFIFAPELVGAFAPSFITDQEKFELTVNLTRILSPFLFFVSLAALCMGVLNSYHSFFVPALAPASFNVATILSMIGLTSFFISQGYSGVYSLGVGALIGGALQFFLQLPFVFKRGLYPLIPAKIWVKESKKVIKLLGPGFIGFAATQVNLVVNTILATSAAVGATSWLSYSFRLFQLPVGILSVSIGNSNLVHFSNAWKGNQKEEAKEFLRSSYFLSLLLVLPCAVLLFVFAKEYVNLIFERGKFDAFSTAQTALALKCYSLGLPLYSLYKIWVPTFYAIDRQKIPVISSIIGIVFNIVFSVTLVDRFGFGVLALSTSLSMLVNCLILGTLLKKDLELNLSFFFQLKELKLLVSCAIMFASLYQLRESFEIDSLGIWGKVFVLGGASVLGLGIYGGILLLLGEKSSLRKVLKRRQKG